MSKLLLIINLKDELSSFKFSSIFSLICVFLKASTSTVAPSPSAYENCEIFSPAIQLRWTVDSLRQKIRFKLSGCQSNSVE